MLSSMGMVASRRRVGTLILAPSDVEPLRPAGDPLAHGDPGPQGAAALADRAAHRRGAPGRPVRRRSAPRLEAASRLVGLAAQMWAAGQSGDQAEFLGWTSSSTTWSWQSSGNDMLLKLHKLVAEVLAGRHHYGLMPHHPHEDALQLHADVAHAIQHKDGERARTAMLQIMEQALLEMSSIWAFQDETSPG